MSKRLNIGLIAAEIGGQIEYFRRLAVCIGYWQAIRVRLATLGGRIGLCDSSLISFSHPILKRNLIARMHSTDLDVFGQVIKDQQYSVVADLAPQVIVDCGANVGYTSAYFLNVFPEAYVIAIEPLPSNAEMCRRNLAPYGDRATVIEAGVWETCGRLAIDKPVGNEWGIRVRPVQPGEAGIVDAIDIPSLKLPKIDLLKVDIERSEISVFGPNSSAWLPTVSHIVIELHGIDCEQAFYSALSDYEYELQRSGELTVCRHLRRRPHGDVDTINAKNE